jgi:Ca2+-binding EF-hand superfamily protein
MDAAQFEKMFSEIDLNKDGSISYTEFVASGIGIETELTDEKLEAAFKLLDVDNAGELEIDALVEFFEVENFAEGGFWEGLKAAMEIDNFKEQADKDKDDRITLEEFKNAIKTQSFKPLDTEVPFLTQVAVWATLGLISYGTFCLLRRLFKGNSGE